MSEEYSEKILDEIQAGLYERFHAPCSSPVFPGFSGERRAMYYSMARRNMDTVVADAVMTHCQQNGDLAVMKKLKQLNDET